MGYWITGKDLKDLRGLSDLALFKLVQAGKYVPWQDDPCNMIATSKEPKRMKRVFPTPELQSKYERLPGLRWSLQWVVNGMDADDGTLIQQKEDYQRWAICPGYRDLES